MALPSDDESPEVFGVTNKRTGDPVNPPSIDRQRIFMGAGGDIGMNATARTKAGGGISVTRAKPGAFAARQRTLRKG